MSTRQNTDAPVPWTVQTPDDHGGGYAGYADETPLHRMEPLSIKAASS